MHSGKLKGDEVSSCYISEEGRRASASLFSSVLLPAGDPKQLQNLESMNLSNYVKLMNLVCVVLHVSRYDVVKEAFYMQ